MALPFRSIIQIVSLTLMFGAAAHAQPTTIPRDALYQAALEALAAGHNEQAAAQLEMLVLETPDHAGAWLDLAILFCQSSAQDRAQALFAHIEERFAPPPAIREIIARYRASGCQVHQPLPRLRLSLGGGYDSNARLGSALKEISLGGADNPFEVTLARSQRAKASPLASFQGEVSYPLGVATEIFGHFQRWDYGMTPDVNTSVWSVGLVHSQVISEDLRLELSGALTQATLGGDAFHRNAALRANLPLLAPRGDMPGFGLEGSYINYQFKLNPIFDSQVWTAQGHLPALFGPGLQDLSIGFISDIAEGARPGGDRYGWMLQWQAQWPTPSGQRWEIMMREQTLRSTAIYSPGLIDRRRTSVSRQAGAAWTIPSGEDQELRLQVRYLLGRDSIPLFRYESVATDLTWTWTWR
ncbi:MAG: tetratricopeptide repeat protein [Rhodocyclaceae bacterium]|jgi:hypothetical protein|nr:tetratricopeptide repeat protein [Rhodocyclaceae bacterium]